MMTHAYNESYLSNAKDKFADSSFMVDSVLILCGYREHGFIRFFHTAALLTDSFSVGCQYCSRCVFDKNRRVFTPVIAYSGILSCGYASGNIGNDRIGVHIYKIQSGFTAPTA